MMNGVVISISLKTCYQNLFPSIKLMRILSINSVDTIKDACEFLLIYNLCIKLEVKSK